MSTRREKQLELIKKTWNLQKEFLNKDLRSRRLIYTQETLKRVKGCSRWFHISQELQSMSLWSRMRKDSVISDRLQTIQSYHLSSIGNLPRQKERKYQLHSICHLRKLSKAEKQGLALWEETLARDRAWKSTSICQSHRTPDLHLTSEWNAILNSLARLNRTWKQVLAGNIREVSDQRHQAFWV